MTLKEHLYEALFRGENENKLKAFEQLLGDDIEQYSIDINNGCVYIYAKDKNPYIDIEFKEDIFNKIITATRASSINKICINSTEKNTQTAYIYINKGIDFKNIEIECNCRLQIKCEKKGLVPLMNLKKLDMNGHNLIFYRSPKFINVHIENVNIITYKHTISLSPCKNSTIITSELILDITEKQNALYSKLNKYLSLNRGYQAAGECYSLISYGNDTALKCIGWDPKSYFTQLFKVETKDGGVEAKI